ncbi:tryptophan--tRNA ligase [bacterium]|nr:tryptophan--tRNA ligase [bacterium]
MKKRILSGMRPTGRLHLGNYVGALENWIRLQDMYFSYHMVADWHMLTTDLKHTGDVAENSIQVVIDWLSAGLDPKKSPIFIQSHIKEHAELHLILSMLVTVARLQRNPTVKEQARDLGLEAQMSYGHLGYPVLQSADILVYNPHAVPVGEDQAAHVEITRELARRFNHIFGPVFNEPETVLTRFARLPGLDGKKMSKSMNNAIFLSDDPKDVQKKMMTAYTDPLKIKKDDPGHPDGCVIMAYHKLYLPESAEEIECDCKAGKLGCVAHKRQLAQKVSSWLEPLHERRTYFDANRDEVIDIIKDGDMRARKQAQEVMGKVREAMQLG